MNSFWVHFALYKTTDEIVIATHYRLNLLTIRVSQEIRDGDTLDTKESDEIDIKCDITMAN
uniref:Uncharacterized protein n=1 Tax=Schistosoma haematobium TaxID=6185 RepID=A0A095CCT4_SCHHA